MIAFVNITTAYNERRKTLEFYLYKSKRRYSNNSTPQSNVAPSIAKDKTIRAGIWGDLLKEYEYDKEASGIENESEYIRSVFKKHLAEKKKQRQEFELSDIC